MLVAKTYRDCDIISEPFLKGKKEYVKVLYKDKIKEVRVYTEKEYARMYPDGDIQENGEVKFSRKRALGFDNGYITIFKGNTYDNLEWFKASPARYAKWWGWYIPSTLSVPEDLPEGIEPIRLNWELVGKDEYTLLSETTIAENLAPLLYEAGNSEYVGEIGDKLELLLTVTKAYTFDGAYGSQTMHTFEDNLGNIFLWTTAAKTLRVGQVYSVKGTVKDHNLYQNTKQTILTRCKVKEEE